MASRPRTPSCSRGRRPPAACSSTASRERRSRSRRVQPPATPGALRRLFRGLRAEAPPLFDAGPAPRDSPLVLFVVARADDRVTLGPLVQAARGEPRTRTAVVAAETLPQLGTRRDAPRRRGRRAAAARAALDPARDARGRGLARAPRGRLRRSRGVRSRGRAARPAAGRAAHARARGRRSSSRRAPRSSWSPWRIGTSGARSAWPRRRPACRGRRCASARARTTSPTVPTAARTRPLSLALAPGEDAALVLARLREVARDRVGAP